MATTKVTDQATRERAERFAAQQWARFKRTSTARDLRQSADSLRDQRRSGR